MSVFVQKLNVLTGNTEWQLQDDSYDFHQEIARSAFADMLHDSDRNQKYYAALRRAIKEKHDRGQDAHVLDIGTGTGLLSMMAAACGADSVVACECFQPMASIAKEVIAANGFDRQIQVVCKRSTELVVGKDMQRRANILVTEVFDTELIGEGAIDTFNHAHQHLLEEGAVVIPSVGRIYGLLLECSILRYHNQLRDKWTLPNSQDSPITLPQEFLNCNGSPALHDLQLSQLPPNSFKKLTKPVEIFRFDFTKGGIKFDETTRMKTEVLAAGRTDCLAVWWELDMLAEEGSGIISCAPEWLNSQHSAWRDHWMQAVYHIQQPHDLCDGLSVDIVSYHDQFSMWFDIKSIYEESTNISAPVCTCGYHSTNSRTRTAGFNDIEVWKRQVDVLAAAVDEKSVVLFCGDTSLLPLAAARLGAHKVYCVEETIVALQVMKSIIEHNKLGNKVVLLPRYVLIVEQVTHVICEPYLRAALLPWEHLRIWYLAKSMTSDTSPVTMMPHSATIWAMPVEFEHLHKIRAPLGSVEGFNLTSFDKLIKSSSDISDPVVEPHPLWEYPCVALSAPTQLMKLDLTDAIPEKCISQDDNIIIER
ncbi:hypothetical protein AAG570_013509 [Ranatra chinensis]|uniref:Protein arginine N-methyltransferase domain-containing protein n=1 Tax=Ranatra chinensis TaxID=642074 RepID=A0ABD0YCD5_9HEMI